MNKSIITHYWNPQNGGGSNNFGDMLVPIIIKWISGMDTEYVPYTQKNKLLVIGSEMANPRVLQEGDVVWGYGAKYDREIIPPKNVKFLSVRGKKTKKLIKSDNIPDVFGDPALLMPKIYECSKNKKYKVGVIPHYIDKKSFNIQDKEILTINVQDDVYKVINQINSCEVIVSTSLHGCIVSEAYGIPVVWLKVSEKIGGLEFKWNDYFSGTQRDSQSPQTLNNISKIIDKVLPQPVINTNALIKAWRDYFGGETYAT